MARLPRFFAAGYPLHIIQRGNNRAPTFCSIEDCVHYLQLLGAAAAKHGLEIHAHTVMSNHVHLLATPRRPESVSETMQALGRSYVLGFNRKYGRTGTLWEGRYRATVVDTDRYLLTCQQYIEENSLRAGMVDDPADYRWSSYRANALGAHDPVVTPHPVYVGLAPDDASRQAAYRGLFTKPLSGQDLCAIRNATNRAWALGDAAFQKWIENQTGRRAAPLPPGPRRQPRAAGESPRQPELPSGEFRL
jgi:putative transposase